MVKRNVVDNREADMSDALSDDQDGDEGRSSDRKFINSLSRGFDILRAFRPGTGQMGNQELSQATGIPKATVSRLTHTLSELGYLRYVPKGSKYELTESILALGYAVLSNMSVRQIARDPMQHLAISQNVTVALAARDRLSMIFIDVFNANALSSLHLDAGSRVPLATTAVGRAFLAGLNSEERAFFFERLRDKYGQDIWLEMREKLEDAVQQVDSRGFCYVEDDWHHGMRAIGVPLKSFAAQPLKAMLAGAPSFSVSREKLEAEVGPQLVHMCRQITPMLR